MAPSTSLLPMRQGFTPRQCQIDATRAFQYHMRIGTSRMLIEMVMASGKGDLIAGLLVRAARAGRRVAFFVNRDFLLDDVFGRTLLVDPSLYAGRVQGKRNEVDRPVLFVSLQTACNEDRARQLGHIDYLFVDEVHGFDCESGHTALRVLTEINPALRVTGFTATAFKAGAKGRTTGLGRLFGTEVGGTEEPIFSYRMADGIRDGVLAPLRGTRMPPLFDRAKVDPEDTRSVAEVLDTNEHNAAVVEAYLRHGGGPGVAFCVDVPHAIHLAECAVRMGVNAAPVWETSTKKDPRTGLRIGSDPDRKRKLDAARAGEIHLLTNMNLLSTGFDWPACKKVLSVQPTGSAVLWPQQVGRGLRVFGVSDERPQGLTCDVLDFVDNTLVHDLGLGANLSTPPEAKERTFDLGDVVRHCYATSHTEGVVTQVEEEGRRALVEWRDHPANWYSADDLVLVRKRRERESLTIAPAITGLAEYAVLLIRGDAAAGWYAYTPSTGGKTYTVRTAMPDGEVRVHVRGADGGFEAWFIFSEPGDDGYAVDVPRLHSSGHATPEDAMEAIGDGVRANRGRFLPIQAEWMGRRSTPKQHGRLRYFGKRAGLEALSQGEASCLIGALSSIRAIGDLLDPKKARNRERWRAKFREERAGERADEQARIGRGDADNVASLFPAGEARWARSSA